MPIIWSHGVQKKNNTQVIQSDLFIPWLEVTNNLWKGHGFTIPKRSKKNNNALPETNISPGKGISYWKPSFLGAKNVSFREGKQHGILFCTFAQGGFLDLCHGYTFVRHGWVEPSFFLRWKKVEVGSGNFRGEKTPEKTTSGTKLMVWKRKFLAHMRIFCWCVVSFRGLYSLRIQELAPPTKTDHPERKVFQTPFYVSPKLTAVFYSFFLFKGNIWVSCLLLRMIL